MHTALRTAGIWIEEGYILLESLADREVWGIPGGRLEPDESAEAGCLREYREELGLEMQIDGLALLHENFWRAGNVGPRVTRCAGLARRWRSATLLCAVSSAVRLAQPSRLQRLDSPSPPITGYASSSGVASGQASRIT